MLHSYQTIKEDGQSEIEIKNHVSSALSNESQVKRKQKILFKQ